MDILFLSPQPFYQDRGSPIAVDLVLKVLAERGDKVDVVTYHVGQHIEYNENITIHRTPNIPFIRQIEAGFSWKKVVCDILMSVKVASLISRKRYQLIHAVEEAVFFALLLKILFKVPYVYDMDSSLAQQMIEQFPWLSPFSGLLNYFERLAVKNAKVVVPVCDALANDVKRYEPPKIETLYDVSLLEEAHSHEPVNLRRQLKTEGLLVMYVGNLQAYQGIDLLLESFASVLNQTNLADLVIIGGADSDIEKYQKQTRHLKIDHKVHFLGPKPVETLASYLSQTDILVSPRIKGKNTPMKIYSYLHSGKALIATDLATHTQVLDHRVAVLAEPSPEAFAQGLLQLLEDRNLRLALGKAGKQLIEEKFTYAAFNKRLTKLLDWLNKEIVPDYDVKSGKVVYSSK